MSKEATADTVQNVAVYIEDYLDLVENVPNEVIRHVSQLHEKNHYYNQCLKKLESALHSATNGESSEAKIRKTLQLIQKCLIEIQSLSDEKLGVVQSIYDALDSKARQLDHDYRNIASSGNANNVITPVKVMKENTRSYVPKQGLVSNYNHTMNGHDESIEEPERPSRSNRETESTKKLPNSASSNSLDSIDKDDEDDFQDNLNGRSSSPTPSGKRSTRRGVSKPKDTVHEKKKEDKSYQSPAKSKNIKRQMKTPKELNQKRSKRESSPTAVFNDVDPDEPTYCLCAQVSFGEMIGCDNNSCPIEWFHFQCVQLTTKPKGKWYCPKCRGDRPNVPKK